MVDERRAVFVDRDGTLIVEREYLADPDGVELVPGAVDALRQLRDAGFALVVVTNQSGVARGFYSEDDYRAVARRLNEILAAAGAQVDATYYCPHHPDFSGPCPCRKPGTGMFRQAEEELGVVLRGSYFIGDRPKDVLPALALGGKGILVRTGYGAEHDEELPAEVEVVEDLGEAARRILGARGVP